MTQGRGPVIGRHNIESEVGKIVNHKRQIVLFIING